MVSKASTSKRGIEKVSNELPESSSPKKESTNNTKRRRCVESESDVEVEAKITVTMPPKNLDGNKRTSPSKVMKESKQKVAPE